MTMIDDMRRRLAGGRGGAPAAAPAAEDEATRELRARRDALADRVAELTFDLGGLTYEAAARGRQRDFRLMPSRRWATVSQRSIADSSDS
ncbi:MAG: hypothetical protein E6G10_02810 [Actinobacteria bacterium]|nr:MAG: hypothetical protein E6G10_02810 [Actinomycetota bacterium]